MGVFFFHLPLKVAGKTYRFNNPRYVEELQPMLLESDDENDRVECENESDLEDADYMEVHSEDSHTEQDSSSKGELDMNEEFLCFCGGQAGKDKESNGRKIQ